MGIFATYNGFIYNEVFALPVEAAWGSCYSTSISTLPDGKQGYALKPNCVYYAGLDPRWAQASNSLTFVNNLKMKLAVIIAIIHMSLGIFMKAFNAVFFSRWVDFFFEFLPQICLLWALFGWMDFLIVYKWLVNWEYHDPGNSQSIISTMINMFLKLGEPAGEPMFNSQQTVSVVFLIIAFASIPLMLLVKPFYLRAKGLHHEVPVSQVRDAEDSLA